MYLLNGFAVLIMLHAAFSAPVSTQELISKLNEVAAKQDFIQTGHLQALSQSMISTIQGNLNAAIENWWNTLSNWGRKAIHGAKTSCSHMPSLNNVIVAQSWSSNLGKTISTIIKACKIINGGEATTEGLLGFNLQELKNKGKQLVRQMSGGCAMYRGGAIAVGQAKAVSQICSGLGDDTAVIQALLDNTVGSVLKDKLAQKTKSQIFLFNSGM